MAEQFPVIEGFEIIEPLGQGGMSQVYKAKQLQLARLVAIKVLTKIESESDLKRFQREAQLTSQLQHPNVVQTIAFGVCGSGSPYLVLEYIEGRSLREELKRNGTLSFQKFSEIFLPILSALDYAHKNGIVHRDIKPENIMLSGDDGSITHIKLLDFGIAKGSSNIQSLTATGAVIGTPNYMSPEQCVAGEITPQTDLYALSCVMFEAVFGSPPFQGDNAFQILSEHMHTPPPTVPELVRSTGVSPSFAEAILWGLKKDAAERPPSAGALAAHLRKALETITLDKIATSPLSIERKSRNNGTAIMSALSIVLIVLACVSLWHFGQSKPKQINQKSIALKEDVGASIDKAREFSENGKHDAAVTELLPIYRNANNAFNLLDSQRAQVCLRLGLAAKLKSAKEKGEESIKTGKLAVDALSEGLRLSKSLPAQKHAAYVDELAESQLMIEDWVGAAKTCEMGYQLYKKYKLEPIVLYYVNGRALSGQGRYLDAISCYKQSLAISDSRGIGRKSYSAILSTLNLYDAAKSLNKSSDPEVVEEVRKTEKDLYKLEAGSVDMDMEIKRFADFLAKNFGQKRGKKFSSFYEKLPRIRQID